MTAEVSNISAHVRHLTLISDVFSDVAMFDHYQRVAKVFAASQLVPQHFRGNTADCLIVLQIAKRLDEDPLTVFQSIYLVNGRPGWITAYLIARANRAGVFRSPITWDESGKGDDLAVTARAVLSGTGEEVRVTCDMRMAKAEQWTRNSKYTSMPIQMLRWRSAAMLIRLYAPEITLGIPTAEEAETMPPQKAMRDVTPARTAGQALDDFSAQVDRGEEEAFSPIESLQGSDSAQRTADENPEPAVRSDSRSGPEDGSESGGKRQASEPSESSDPPSHAAAGAKQEASTAPGGAERHAGEAAPRVEGEYVAHAMTWIDALTDLAEGERRWKEEKQLRNHCNVAPEVRDKLIAALQAKIELLKAQQAPDDPITVAKQRGAEAYHAGHSRKAVPGEYRMAERQKEADAWWAGFDAARAEDDQSAVRQR